MAEARAADFDALLIATDHDAMDYAALASLGLPIIDTRNAMADAGFQWKMSPRPEAERAYFGSVPSDFQCKQKSASPDRQVCEDLEKFQIILLC